VSITRMKFEAAPCRHNLSDWVVEAYDMESEGECYCATFYGMRAEDRAREYAEWKNAGGGIDYREPSS